MFRCVPESQRSFSLGLTNVIAKIFGSFPAPIIFGAIFDSTCVVWQTDEEGTRNGSCWIYDADKLSWRMLILSEFLMIGTIVALMCSLYLYKPVEPDRKWRKNKPKVTLRIRTLHKYNTDWYKCVLYIDVNKIWFMDVTTLFTKLLHENKFGIKLKLKCEVIRYNICCVIFFYVYKTFSKLICINYYH